MSESAITDDAIHMLDRSRPGRTLCDQPIGTLNVSSWPPDGGSGCWSCLKEYERPLASPDVQGWRLKARRVGDVLAGLPWHLRHPTCRRCPQCRLTWETPDMLRAQGGVCHDCYGHTFDDPPETVTDVTLSGLPRSPVNPYFPGTPAHGAWARGFAAAMGEEGSSDGV